MCYSLNSDMYTTVEFGKRGEGMASVKHECITVIFFFGGGKAEPPMDLGHSPWSGDQGAKPFFPEAETLKFLKRKMCACCKI